MWPEFAVGDHRTMSYVVTTNKTVPHLFPELSQLRAGQPVLASGFMTGLLEEPCMAALHPCLPSGYTSLGTEFNWSHCGAATPGTVLSVEVICTKIDGNYVEWNVCAKNSAGRVLARGTHGRRVVEVERFLARIRPESDQYEMADAAANEMIPARSG